MTTRCKFKVNSITRLTSSRQKLNEDGTPFKNESGHVVYEPCEMRSIKMSPVYGNGDPNHENTKFWQASPSGQFELGVINLAAAEMFELGKEYYIDIMPAG